MPICTRCGGQFQAISNDTDTTAAASRACRQRYLDVVERDERSRVRSEAFPYVHTAYAAQHAQIDGQRASQQALLLNLGVLYCTLQDGLGIRHVKSFRVAFGYFLQEQEALPIIRLPKSFGSLTIQDLWTENNPIYYISACEQYAWSVWYAWSDALPHVEDLVQHFYEDYLE